MSLLDEDLGLKMEKNERWQRKQECYNMTAPVS